MALITQRSLVQIQPPLPNLVPRIIELEPRAPRGVLGVLPHHAGSVGMRRSCVRARTADQTRPFLKPSHAARIGPGREARMRRTGRAVAGRIGLVAGVVGLLVAAACAPKVARRQTDVMEK